MNLTKATPSNINAIIEDNEGRLAKAIKELLTGLDDNEVVDENLYVCDKIPDSWDNGSGYLDGGVDDGSLSDNIQIIGLDSKQRLVHVTNTPNGNVILFDRYPHGDSAVVVANMPVQITRMYGSLMRGQLSDAGINNSVRYNLGKAICDMIKYSKEA